MAKKTWDDIDPHDHHMNEIMLKVGALLDGEDLFDVACVGAMMSAYALGELSRGDRGVLEQTLVKVVGFLRRQARRVCEQRAE
jgi:hypothetical protein